MASVQLVLAKDAPEAVQKAHPKGEWFIIVTGESIGDCIETSIPVNEIEQKMREHMGISFFHAQEAIDGKRIHVGTKLEPLLMGLFGPRLF